MRIDQYAFFWLNKPFFDFFPAYFGQGVLLILFVTFLRRYAARRDYTYKR
jgi:hypothetical protein